MLNVDRRESSQLILKGDFSSIILGWEVVTFRVLPCVWLASQLLTHTVDLVDDSFVVLPLKIGECGT